MDVEEKSFQRRSRFTRNLVPGLLESAYERCLHHELDLREIAKYRKQSTAGGSKLMKVIG